jgi:hypothetical protein
MTCCGGQKQRRPSAISKGEPQSVRAAALWLVLLAAATALPQRAAAQALVRVDRSDWSNLVPPVFREAA